MKIKSRIAIIGMIGIFILLFACGFFTACSEGDYPIKIELIENSMQTEYFVGEQIDASSAKFRVEFSNKESRVINADDENIKIDDEFVINTTPGKQFLAVGYNLNENHKVTTNIEITFKAVSISNFVLIAETLPTTAKKNSSFSTAGIKGVATFSNGLEIEVEAKDISFSSLNTGIVGMQQVKATYLGATAEFYVNVLKPVIVEMIFSSAPYSTYEQNAEIDLERILIQLTFDDGTYLDLQASSLNFQIRNFSTEQLGTFVLEIKYVGEDFDLQDDEDKLIFEYQVI